MPLTDKGQKILANMEREYGAEKAKRVLYASKNAGTISGIDACEAYDDADVEAAAAFMDELRGKGRGDSIGAKLDAACAKLDACTRADVSEGEIEPRKNFWLKRQKPLPSGKTVRIRVSILWKEKDGRWLARIVTPGLYQGGNEKVGPEDLET